MKWIFEHGNVPFWRLVDFIMNNTLGNAVEERTIELIAEKFQEVRDSSKRKKILDRCRANFDPKVPSIFSIELPFFGAKYNVLWDFRQEIGRAKALDDVYNVNGQFGILPIVGRADWLSRFHLNRPGGQAVRNRYKLVTEIIYRFEWSRGLSVACGSAQPLLHAMSLKRLCGNDCNVLLTDSTEEALELAHQRANDFKVQNFVCCERISLEKLGEFEDKFDIIEVCGILDYLSDSAAIRLIRTLLGMIRPNGMIITSNMIYTKQEAECLERMYNWQITYRTPEQLEGLIKKAGGKDIVVYVEPWGVHAVATARK